MRITSVLLIVFYSFSTSANGTLTERICQEMVRIPVNYTTIESLIYQGANVDCHCQVVQKTEFLEMDKTVTRFYDNSIPKEYIKSSNHDYFIESVYIPPLQIALNRDDHALIRFLVHQGADIKYATYNNLTPLEFAYHSNNRPLIDLLISLGASPQDMQLGCPFDLSTARYLISRGANPSTIRIDCALLDKNRVEQILALQPGGSNKRLESYSFNELIEQPKVLEVLLNNNFAVNQVNNKIEKKTLLMLAADKGYSQTIELLLRNRAAINQPDAEGYTALYYAIKNNHYDVIKVLLQKGASSDIIANDGKDSPIHLAISSNQANIVQLLLEYNYGVSKSGTDLASNPLIISFEQRNMTVAKLLIEHGEDVNQLIEYYGAEYLYEHPEDLKFALLLGISPNLLVSENNLLHKAIIEDNETIFHELLQYKVNTNTEDEKGYKPLDYAIEKGNIMMTVYLVRAGADVHNPFDSTRSYLHQAIEQNSFVMTHTLLEAGADIWAINIDGHRILWSAIHQENIDIVKLLLRYDMPVDCEALFEAVAINDFDLLKSLLTYRNELDCRLKGKNLYQYAKQHSTSYSMIEFLKLRKQN